MPVRRPVSASVRRLCKARRIGILVRSHGRDVLRAGVERVCCATFATFI
jgi:hypothetical protein